LLIFFIHLSSYLNLLRSSFKATDESFFGAWDGQTPRIDRIFTLTVDSSLYTCFVLFEISKKM